MTIERFGDWGRPVDGSDAVGALAGDAELAVAAYESIQTGGSTRASLAGGDLMRTLGLDAPRLADDRYEYPIDLGLARSTSVDGDDDWVPFSAHAAAGRVLGPGWFCAVMNAPWLGGWRLGPKAHPNDGKLDVTSGTIPLRQVPEARRRAATGTHIPHPGLRQQRTAEARIDFPRPLVVRLDGRVVGRWPGFDLKVLDDAATLVA